MKRFRSSVISKFILIAVILLVLNCTLQCVSIYFLVSDYFDKADDRIGAFCCEYMAARLYGVDISKSLPIGERTSLMEMCDTENIDSVVITYVDKEEKLFIRGIACKENSRLYNVLEKDSRSKLWILLAETISRMPSEGANILENFFSCSNESFHTYSHNIFN